MMQKMETFQQIYSHLRRYKADDLRTFLNLFAAVISRNPDFFLLLDAPEEQEDILNLVEEMTGKTVTYDTKHFLTDEEMNLLRELYRLDGNTSQAVKKVKKAQAAEMLAAGLSSAAFFEGFFLVCTGKQDTLEQLAADLGCTEKFRNLAADPVFQKRKAYMRMLSDYALASVNLYGVIHLHEYMDLVERYEPKLLKQMKGYQRTEGAYAGTLVFTPEWWCTYTVHQVVGNCIPDLISTMDAFLVNHCFGDAVKSEHERIFRSFAELGHAPTEKDLAKFFENADASFRELYFEASEKDMYLPAKKEFLRYADETYYEHTNEERRLEQYLSRHFSKEFQKAAEEFGLTKDQLIEYFLEDLHWEAADMDEDGDRDPNDSIQETFELLESYGVLMSMDQAQEFLGLLMPLMNAVRLWSNHGHTPVEISRMHPRNRDNLTIVPGSSTAAAMLAEGRDEIEKMGFHLDLDGNAANVTQHAFPNGPNGRMVTTTRKIYPNDPCPCGSGKKYKKCCGKR